MPASSPPVASSVQKVLRELGQRLRARRKKLGISAVATAEAAGMSRITLHRIERGEPSVAMGAYISAVSALGLALDLADPRTRKRAEDPAARKKLPSKVRLANYPQLKRVAWQLKGTREVGLQEALELYERNWRHVDLKQMDEREKEFVEALLIAFGKERLLV